MSKKIKLYIYAWIHASTYKIEISDLCVSSYKPSIGTSMVLGTVSIDSGAIEKFTPSKGEFKQLKLEMQLNSVNSTIQELRAKLQVAEDLKKNFTAIGYESDE